MFFTPYFLRVIGILAGLGTTISFSQQLSTLWIAQSPQDIEGISLSMFIVHLSGLFLWVLYGIGKEDFVIIIFNLICSLFVGYCIYKIIDIRLTDETTKLSAGISQLELTHVSGQLRCLERSSSSGDPIRHLPPPTILEDGIRRPSNII